MKPKMYFGIAIRIVLLFTIAIFATLIPEQLRDFFGDTWNKGDKFNNPHWEWGIRHYWFNWMGVLLFLLSILNLVIYIVSTVKKNYDTHNW